MFSELPQLDDLSVAKVQAEVLQDLTLVSYGFRLQGLGFSVKGLRFGV